MKRGIMTTKHLLSRIRTYNKLVDAEFNANQYSDKYNDLVLKRGDVMRELSSDADLTELTSSELVELLSYYGSFRPMEPWKVLMIVGMVHDRSVGG